MIEYKLDKEPSLKSLHYLKNEGGREYWYVFSFQFHSREIVDLLVCKNFMKASYNFNMPAG